MSIGGTEMRPVAGEVTEAEVRKVTGPETVGRSLSFAQSGIGTWSFQAKEGWDLTWVFTGAFWLQILVGWGCG